jgi:pimeloyl-ACP methyl ester carboxylesterase
MKRLIGLRDFVHDMIEKTTDLVEGTHEAVMQRPIAVLSSVGAGAAARAVDAPRAAIAKLVFDSIRATNRSVQAVSDLGLATAKAILPEADATKPASAFGEWMDAAQGVLNAVGGDFLEARNNGLSIQPHLRYRRQPLVLTPGELARAMPGATAKVCLFLHGLGCTDAVWQARDQSALDAAEPEPLSFGIALQRERGYTPIYLRYNSGLHVSENGRALASLLEQLSNAYPCELGEIALVGHSMGGLVGRSAAHYGHALGHAWVKKLRHVLCIGSPHFGTLLERAGNVITSVLSAFDTAGTQVPAKVFNARSAGIKDLRFGSVLDEDWRDLDPDAFFSDRSQHAPFADGVAYGYIAARLRPQSGIASELIGDLLVHVRSASGQHRDVARSLPFHMGHVIDGVSHVAVYEQLLRFLGT